MVEAMRRQLGLDLGHELIIDNFAGGGGASTGIEAAFGRPVDIAINHDPEALAMHALNHPYTRHICESVWKVDPVELTGNRPVGLVWLSPDCKHFSKAKGGKPVAKNIRGLAWVTLRWLLRTSPRSFALENVEEFQTWGGLMRTADGKWVPDPSKKGQTFNGFVGMITTGIAPDHPALPEACEFLGIEIDSPEARRLVAGLGYTLGWRELRASHDGAPTIRKRLFMFGRRDGLSVRWAEQSHADPDDRRVLAKMLAPYRTAAECIDFSIQARSVFGRDRALVTNTMRRVAKGLWRHVLSSAKPYIVNNEPVEIVDIQVRNPATESGYPHDPVFPVPPATVERPHDLLCKNCHNTFPTWRPGDEHIAGACPTCGSDTGIGPIDEIRTAPFLTEHANGSNQRTMPANEPLRTQCAQVKGGHFSVVASKLARLRGTAEVDPGQHDDAGNQPLPVDGEGFTQRDAQFFQRLNEFDQAIEDEQLTAYTIAPLRGTSEAHLGGHNVKQPLSTVSAGGTHHGLVGAHLVTIGYGERKGQDARAQDIKGPIGTIVTANKHAMVSAHLTKFRTGSQGQSLKKPMPTVTANSFIKRPGGAAPLGIVAAHLTHVTHHGERPGTTPAEPLPTVTGAHRGEQVLVSACLEQAYGGFAEDNDGRPVTTPVSTIMTKGANQRLITAYLVKVVGDDGVVESLQFPAGALAPEHVERARECAQLLHEHLPERFPEAADVVLMEHDGNWWCLVDITLRMLVPKELYRAQSFPEWYITHEIPDPKLLFKDGVQVEGDPRLIPRIPLSITAQVRMCGNSVAPVQAEALIRANFAHEKLLQSVAA